MYDQYGFPRDVKHRTKSEENMSLTGEDFHGTSESVSSSEPEAVGKVQVSQWLDSACQTESNKVSVRKHYPMPLRSMFCGTIILVFIAFICFFWVGGDQDKGYYLPPT